MNFKLVLSIAVLIAVITGFFVVSQTPEVSLGGVGVGDQYQSTTTRGLADLTNLCPARSGMPQRTSGVLGTIDIFNANTGGFAIYDATTSNSNLRLGNIATNTILLADVPGSPTETAYPLDLSFQYGLLVDYDTAGTVSTTTITYRCEN